MNFEEAKEKLKQFSKENLQPARGSRSTPMGKLFDGLSKYLDNVDKEGDQIELLYSRLPNDKKSNVSVDKSIEHRFAVISYLLENILAIHTLSLKANNARKDLISIPLYDMKIVGKLVNTIVVEGVYCCLPLGTGIPLEKRRLKNFQIPLQLKKVPLPAGKPILESIVSSFITIYGEDSDLKDLVLQGTGFTDVLSASITLCTYPPFQNDEKYPVQFKEIEKSAGTFNLLSTYGLFMASPLQTWFKTFVLERLSILPYERSNGVQSLIELVLGLRDSEQVEINKIQHITKLLINKPKSLDSAEYFNRIGSQMYEILVLINRPIMVSIVSHILEQLHSMKFEPFTRFIFQKVWKAFNPSAQNSDTSSIVLTSEIELNNAFNVIISITSNISEPSLLSQLFDPFNSSLWNYMLFKKRNNMDYKVVEQVYSNIISSQDNHFMFELIVNSLGSSYGDVWEFAVGENKLVYIKETIDRKSNSAKTLFYLDSLDESITSFINILKDAEDDNVQFFFSMVMEKWLSVNSNSVKLEENSFQVLVYLKILSAIIEHLKEKLTSSPNELFKIIEALVMKFSQSSISTLKTEKLDGMIVDQNADSDDEDETDIADENSETINTALGFLSSVLSDASDVLIGQEERETLNRILTELNGLKSSTTVETVKEQIQSLLNSKSSPESDEKLKKKENEKLLEYALIKLNDPQPPVRAHGLQLLRTLFSKPSSGLRLEYIVDIHLNQLSDPEPFIYLNAIKGLEELLEHASKSDEVLVKYLSIYSGPKSKLEQRLRIGEVLTRYVEHNSSSSTILSKSEIIASYCLSMVRRDDNGAQTENTLRMSAMSLLGTCCHIVPASISNYISDALDCVIGILTLETSKEEAVIRRAAIVLVADLLDSESGLSAVPQGYGPRISHILHTVAESDNDLLVREQSNSTLVIIDELFESKLKTVLT